ncbi:START domain-containing protein [Marinilabilia sp.]|uniref:START domain-containing protein n=1 Tax=Marinilabilia sp. TaxID=2021252 RepID=UPI0025BCF847|nr:START domain-containing protein [Marinilabilia sp.]
MNKPFCLLMIIFFVISFSNASAGEDGWQLRKNEDGIKVYTKEKEDTHIYMYKVVTKISVKPEVVYRQVVDFRENLQYMKSVDSIRFLEHQKDRRYINYMRLKMPWPVKNREMVTEMLVTKGQNGIFIESNDLPEYLPKNPGTVRIEDFNEKWTIKEGINQNESQITVTGWVDVGGSIPVWVVNLFIVNTPFRFISGIIQEVGKE